ncbi:MAG: MarR family winged helix-turn-helix transcriptional regulator [Deltaproteobacteria bacterium]
MDVAGNLISMSTTHLLHRAGQLAEDLFARSIGEIGITARQFVVLSVVESLEDPSQTALCDISGIDRSTLADIVRRLVARGLLTRRRTRQDARMYAVRITPEGQEVLRRAVPVAAKVDEALVEALNADQRDQFVSFLQKVVLRQSSREPGKAIDLGIEARAS